MLLGMHAEAVCVCVGGDIVNPAIVVVVVVVVVVVLVSLI